MTGENRFQAVVELPRRVELRFDVPGRAAVVLEGRSDRNGTPRSPARIEQSIVVR